MIRVDNNQGFSLLEMVVSISIIALVLISVFKIQTSMLRLSIAGEFYSTASHLARQKIADIELELNNPLLLNESLLNERSGDFGDSFPDYKWHVTITTLDLLGSQIPESFIDKSQIQNLKNITVEISYKEQFSFKLTSWRFIQNE